MASIAEPMGFCHFGELYGRYDDKFVRPHGRPSLRSVSYGQWSHRAYSATERHVRQAASLVVSVGTLTAGAYEIAQATGLS